MKGFPVTWAKEGKEALTLLQNNPYSLCILDVMLPSIDGFGIAEQMAVSNARVPYIFLTAKNHKVDKRKGFKLGCDDYIVKPADEEELVARIQAVLKRISAIAQTDTVSITQFGNSLFHVQTQVLQIYGTEYELTAQESEVRLMLLSHRNNLPDRESVLKKVWGSIDYFNRRSRDVIISRLRKHLLPDSDSKITNIHGKGYMLQESV